MTASAVDVARVAELLPGAAVTDYGWSPIFIETMMNEYKLGVLHAVRYFWLQRVNETSEYLDINGKPLTQIHAQAVAMLQYWDSVIAAGKEIVNGQERGGRLSFGRIAGPTEGVRCRDS